MPTLRLASILTTLDIRSWLVNAGIESVTTTAAICGVHLRGSLAYRDPFVRCAGYSMRARLAPGDSLADGRHVIVTSPPGRYELEVRQLLDPDFWFRIEIEVVAP